MFGLQKLSPWPLPAISAREVVGCVGKTGAWYMKRTRNMLYKDYEDDLYTVVPTTSITVPVSGPVNVVVRDIDTKATSINTEFSVDAKVVKPPQATDNVPVPGVESADAAFNTVRETNKTDSDSRCDPAPFVTNGAAVKSSPASTGDKCKFSHLKDQTLASRLPLIPLVSSCPGPRYAKTPHQQSQAQLSFDKLRRAKRKDSSNALPDGHSRKITDSSDASTLINYPGGGSRKHSLTALDLASFTHRVEGQCQKPVVATLGPEATAQPCTKLNADPADANAIEHQLQVRLDMAYSKIEAYKLDATSLRSEKEKLIEKNDVALQRAAGVAQQLRCELDSLKKNDSQALEEGSARNDAEKTALRAEITRLCGNMNDMGLQLDLLRSSYDSLETDYESEKRQHILLSESFLRLARGRIEQLEELKALEKAIVKTRHDLGELAGNCFERMVRLTLALKDQGIDAMDEEYKAICERAPYHVGFDERDIVNSATEEIEEEENRKNRAAGGEAGNVDRSNHEILEQVYHMKAPKSEAGQESPETYNIRRRREIAEAEERLLGPTGIAISADGTVKNVQAAKGQLHPDHVRYVLNSSLDGYTIDYNSHSETGKSKDICDEDWQNGALEIRSIFQRPRPTNYELLDLPAPCSSIKGQMVTRDDLETVLPGLNVNVAIPNHDLETAEIDTNSILNPAYAGTERSGYAHDIPYLPRNKSTSSIESDTMDVIPPKDHMAKRPPLAPTHRDEYEAAHPDPAISSLKVAAATDVDKNLHPSQNDEAWLENVLANIAMTKNDYLQSSGDQLAYQLESEAEEDLASSSGFEGEDLEDNQDQIFVDDDDYIGNDQNKSFMGNTVPSSSEMMDSEPWIHDVEEEQDLTSNKTAFQSSDLSITASVDDKSPTGSSSKIEIPPTVLGESSTDGENTAFSILNPKDHIEKPSLLAQNSLSDRNTTHVSPDSNFGGRAILPAFTDSKLMSQVEAASVSPHQCSSQIDFLDANPSSGKTNPELGQAEREQDIPGFDNEANGRDLDHFATIGDQSKVQAPVDASKPSKAFSLPHAERFDFVSRSASPLSIDSRKPLFPTVSSENKAKPHAGFSFPPGFVANAQASPASTEMQTSSPVVNLDSLSGTSALAQQKDSPNAEATVIPSAPNPPDVELWKASEPSSQNTPELASAGTPIPKKDNLGLDSVAQVQGVEEIITSPRETSAHVATAAKADHLPDQSGPPTSPKSYSPPRLSKFSFRSEDLGQPGLSCHHDDSVTALCHGPGNPRSALPDAAAPTSQIKTPPEDKDKKPTEQAKPENPDPNVRGPTENSAETANAKAKATKPKMNIAAAIALEKKAKEQAETAEEKQRELSKKQREAAARRKKDAGDKGGRA
ncbi:hypothetical protein N7G274_010582 [Stereocaulon virgatum]|uniref:Uncharacterized protein n=1 Tax=Stereocaulon virgatum TaxID=373712 RepID=A0ABR3ZTB5_9LECA